MNGVSSAGVRPEFNFRDLGGHVTVDGRRVREGAVFRSAHLPEVTDGELAALLDLGIRTVCDLRAPDEADAWPGPLSTLDGVRVLRLGKIGGRAVGDPVETILEYGMTRVTADDVGSFYRLIVDQQPECFGQVIDACARPDHHAVVIHCSHGKDRTGIASALVLAALGVADDALISDYERTNEHWGPAQLARAEPRLAEAGVRIDDVRAFFSAPGEAMVSTLTHLRRRHGSVEAYLTGPAGVPPTTLAALRDALLTT